MSRTVQIRPAEEELCKSIPEKFTGSSANYITSSYVCPDQMQKKIINLTSFHQMLICSASVR